MYGKKLFVWLIVPLCILLGASAASECTSNQTCTLWASVPDGIDYDNTTSANATIYTPNGSAFADIMGEWVTDGVFRYNYTPNETGVWLVRWNISNETNAIATITESYTVEEGSVVTSAAFSIFTIVISVFLVCVLMLIMAYMLDDEHRWFRVLIYCFVIGMMVVMGGAVLQLSNSMATIFYNSVVWLLGIFGIYLSVYFVVKAIVWFRGAVLR